MNAVKKRLHKTLSQDADWQTMAAEIAPIAVRLA
jgi:hypothetical protein